MTTDQIHLLYDELTYDAINVRALVYVVYCIVMFNVISNIAILFIVFNV